MRLRTITDGPDRTNLIAFTCLALVYLMVAAVSVFAHDPGLSLVEIKFGHKELSVQATFAQAEIAILVPMDADHDGQITTQEFDNARPALESLARESLALTLDGKQIEPATVSAILGESNALQFRIDFVPGNALSAQSNAKVIISSPLISRLARGHRQYLTVNDAWGKSIAGKLLDANNASFESDLGALMTKESKVQAFWGSLKFGIRNTASSFDRLALVFSSLVTLGWMFWFVGRTLIK